MPVTPRRMRSYPWQVIIPVSVYVLLALGGVTQSSIGIPDLREDPENPTGVMIGEAPTIRTDEYFTWTPVDVGVTATGSTEGLNPLAESPAFFSQLPAGPVSSVVVIDGTALRLGPVLPDQMLVAARWWLPFLLLVLAAPPFFRSLTGSRWIGYLAAALIVLSPASAWWSFLPVRIIGFAMAGAAALQVAAVAAQEGRRGRAVGWGALSALLLARTSLYYQPWVIVLLFAVVLVAVTGVLAAREGRRRSLAVVAAIGGLTVVLVAVIVLESWPAITALRGTVYPGSRLSSGAPNPVQDIFGATNLAPLKELATVGVNRSELASAFTVCLLWAILLIGRGVTYRHVGHRAAVYALAVVSGFWFAWSTIEWGPLGKHIPVVSLVPSGRAGDILGFLPVILLCLLLPGTASRNSAAFSLMTAVVTGVAAAHAGSALRAENMPDLPLWLVWVSSALLAAVVFVVTFRPRLWPGYVSGVALAALLVWHVNPVLVGLADLRGSGVSEEMLEAGASSREDDEVWASDAASVDALMTATGVPSVSGRQISGPDVDAWRRLDPDGSQQQVWNRGGGSYIWFEWTDDPEVTMTNPEQDVIHISTSPCALAERVPNLSAVVASRELELECLSESDRFEWGGATRWVYAVAR